jgi:hypothetical protein
MASHVQRASRLNFPSGGEHGALPGRILPYTVPSAPGPAEAAAGGRVSGTPLVHVTSSTARDGAWSIGSVGRL